MVFIDLEQAYYKVPRQLIWRHSYFIQIIQDMHQGAVVSATWAMFEFPVEVEV